MCGFLEEQEEEEGVTLQLYANEAELKPAGKITAHTTTYVRTYKQPAGWKDTKYGFMYDNLHSCVIMQHLIFESNSTILFIYCCSV